MRAPANSRQFAAVTARRIVVDTPALQALALIALFLAAATTISGFVTKPSLYSTLVLASFLQVFEFFPELAVSVLIILLCLRIQHFTSITESSHTVGALGILNLLIAEWIGSQDQSIQ